MWIEEDGKKIQISWHVFIAQIFIPNPQNLPEVNHLDEDKGNCGVDNLEWSTRLDNVRHSSHSWGKNYIVENLKTGEIYEIVNLSKWCKVNEVDRHSAYEVINGIRQTVKKKTFNDPKWQKANPHIYDTFKRPMPKKIPPLNVYNPASKTRKYMAG